MSPQTTVYSIVVLHALKLCAGQPRAHSERVWIDVDVRADSVPYALPIRLIWWLDRRIRAHIWLLLVETMQLTNFVESEIISDPAGEVPVDNELICELGD